MSGIYEWHDEYLTEEFSSIVECLGPNGAKVINIEKTDEGYWFVECCYGYHGVT
ncbi:MAG: hypothetical protein JJ956_18425 [Pseudomonadales bacterium]|nr:hypothetical protein [Pseudomonadales bacterium]